MRLALLAGVLALLAVAASAQPAETSLEQFLGQRGWVGIQLSENVYNQLEADVVIEGEHRVRAQVSTSFSKTVFDQGAIRKLGLPIEPTPIEMSGSGGKQRLGTVRLQSLAFGETVVGAVTIFIADLEKLISRPPGGEPVQAVIGSDFLTRYQAVLEIPTSKLYLRLR
jgi:Aspartyl protease